MNIPNSMSFLREASHGERLSDSFGVSDDAFNTLLDPLVQVAADYTEKFLNAVADDAVTGNESTADLHNEMISVIKTNPVYQGLSDSEFALAFFLYGKVFESTDNIITHETTAILLRKAVAESAKKVKQEKSNYNPLNNVN